MNTKKLCVVTTTRAEYGLLKHLMHEISLSTNFKLQLLVSGTHLSPFHGNTIEEIKNDVDNLAFLVSSEINTQHSRGTDLNGRPGQPMFSTFGLDAELSPSASAD